MKLKKLLLLILLLMCINPIKVFALDKNYKDVIHSIVDKEVEEDKINIYFFRGFGCPHCAKEEIKLEELKEKYGKYINIYDFEVFNNEENANLMREVADNLDEKVTGVPFTIIGEKTFKGYSDSHGKNIENAIKEYIGEEVNKDNINIPVLGDINVKTVSIPIVAVILGFIDGFNPCAMWILLFLISLLFGMESKKKRWILGFTFLGISGLVYFLSMLGINFVVGIATVNWIKKTLALFILVAGILSIKKYVDMSDEAGCTVVEGNKRKKLITRMRKIVNNNSFALSILGIIVLATSVNLIELACSLGFPVVFNEILTLNNVNGILKIIYMLIYILFYMIDDLFVFIVSMATLEAAGITNKYNKLCTLVSGIIMIIMGLLLLLKPEWIMLNF